MDCRLPGSSVHGISQARILEWVAIPFSRASSRPRERTRIFCIGRWILYCQACGEVPGRHRLCAISPGWGEICIDPFRVHNSWVTAVLPQPESDPELPGSYPLAGASDSFAVPTDSGMSLPKRIVKEIWEKKWLSSKLSAPLFSGVIITSTCTYQGLPQWLSDEDPCAMQETQIRSLGQREPLEEGMAVHSSILAWRISWTEEPGGLQSMGSERGRYDWTRTQAYQEPGV